MRAVLDTNILISATMWDNSVSNKLIRALTEKDIEIFTSFDILEEYKKVLRRDFKFVERDINKIIQELLSYLQVIEPTTKIKIVLKDPDDDMIIECALDSNSDFIISYNKHLLDIKEYNGIKIIMPEEFLRIINE